MSTEVKLIGIGNITLPDVPTPCGDMSATARGVVSQLTDLGISGLHADLKSYAEDEPDVLVDLKEETEPGVRQYLLVDPDTFLTHVQENPHYWDSVCYGWPEALAALHQDIEEGHLITWWFIAEY